MAADREHISYATICPETKLNAFIGVLIYLRNNMNLPPAQSCGREEKRRQGNKEKLETIRNSNSFDYQFSNKGKNKNISSGGDA